MEFYLCGPLYFHNVVHGYSNIFTVLYHKIVPSLYLQKNKSTAVEENKFKDIHLTHYICNCSKLPYISCYFCSLHTETCLKKLVVLFDCLKVSLALLTLFQPEHLKLLLHKLFLV
jgi:hypothetical protein